MRALTAVVFMAFVFSIGCAEARVEINAKDKLTGTEKNEIENQKLILDEIAALYAERALERPKDFTACVREMFAMRRSGKCRDRFTHYFTPEDMKRMNEEMRGTFGGAGLELVQEDGYVAVLAPVAGGPAERAGIRSGDIILKVDGKETTNLEEAASLIRGKAGTKVTVAVFRKAGRKELVFTLTREIIIAPTVKERLSSANKTAGIISIKRFDNNVPWQFAEAVDALMEKGAKGAVIDLRNNPGGSVSSVLKLLGFFANDADTLLTYRFRHFQTKAAMTKKAEESFKNFSVVILINNGSASASEIFSGTMKDWGYPIVGEKSYGKGVGQELLPLSDGSYLILTTFEFLVGNRQVAIRDKGVAPTFEVKPRELKDGEDKKDEKNDVQLLKALEVLQSCGKDDPARAYKCTR